MTRYIIGPNDAGQRADRFVGRMERDLKAHHIQVLFRKKDIKINGKPAKPDTRLCPDDEIRVYRPPAERMPGKASREPMVCPAPDVVFENAYMLILWKPAGLLSQPVNGGAQPDLESSVRRYVYESGEWNPDTENAFAPALCHRLDRGTEGLVMAAKTAEVLRIITEKLKNHEIIKTYRCVVHGHPVPAEDHLVDYLWKDASQSRVHICKSYVPGAKTAVLDYRTLSSNQALSLLEITLHTGRTHQIRVQMAGHGWPLLGDSKYGSRTLDKPYKPACQALAAVRLSFRFQTPSGPLEALNGQDFSREKSFAEYC